VVIDGETTCHRTDPRIRAAVRLCRVLFALLAVLAVVACLGGLVARWHMYFELLTHFQIQYMAASAIAAIGLFVCGNRRLAIVPAIVALAIVLRISPWFLSSSLAVESDTGKPLRVMLFNIHEPNRQHDAVIDEIRSANPDLVVFQEVNDRWAAELEVLDDVWSYAHYQRAAMLRGNLVRSRFPMREIVHEPSVSDINAPSLRLTLDVDGLDVALLVAHPPPPHQPYFAALRNQELQRLARRSTELPQPLMLIGDLNTTMWSPYYSDFEAASGLVNTRRGFGIIATFPMNEYRLLRVPIDHCLVSPDIAVTSCRRGHASGSDHAPLIVDVVLPPVSSGR